MSAAGAYTVGTLFSGLEIPGLAAVLNGFEVKFHVEIDAYCQKVIERHADEYWPHAALFSDVRTVGKHNLPSVDVLVGGFPCQDVSFAGKRAGMGENTRSGLWWEFARIIAETRPAVVLIENVPGVLAPVKREKPCYTPDKSTWFIRRASVKRTVAPPPAYQVCAELRRLGYVVRTGVISAADTGASHERKRWWCFATLVDADSLRRQEPRAITNAALDQEWDVSTRERRRRAEFYAALSSCADVADAKRGGYNGREQWHRSVTSYGGSTAPKWTTPTTQAARHCKSQLANTDGARSQGRRLASGVQAQQSCATRTGAGSAVGNAASVRRQHHSPITRSAGEGKRKGRLLESQRASHGTDQPGLDRGFDAHTAWMVGVERPVASPGAFQYAWEAPRTVETAVDNKTNRLKALGNAWCFANAYAMFSELRAWLEAQDAAAAKAA